MRPARRPPCGRPLRPALPALRGERGRGALDSRALGSTPPASRGDAGSRLLGGFSAVGTGQDLRASKDGEEKSYRSGRTGFPKPESAANFGVIYAGHLLPSCLQKVTTVSISLGGDVMCEGGKDVCGERHEGLEGRLLLESQLLMVGTLEGYFMGDKAEI